MTTPKYVMTPRMDEILNQCDPLHDRFDLLRGKYRKPLTEETRALNKQISELMVEFYEISLEVNKEWHAQPPMWQKKFS